MYFWLSNTTDDCQGCSCALAKSSAFRDTQTGLKKWLILILIVLYYFSLYTTWKTKRHKRAKILKTQCVHCCSNDCAVPELVETKIHYKFPHHTRAFIIYIENMLRGNILCGTITNYRFFLLTTIIMKTLVMTG